MDIRWHFVTCTMIPWEPTRLIFRGYNVITVITHILGIFHKSFMFYGFGVQEYDNFAYHIPSQLCEVDLCNPKKHRVAVTFPRFQNLQSLCMQSSMAIYENLWPMASCLKHFKSATLRMADGYSLPARMAIVIRFFSIQKLRNGRSFTRSRQKWKMGTFSTDLNKSHPSIFNHCWEPIKLGLSDVVFLDLGCANSKPYRLSKIWK